MNISNLIKKLQKDYPLESAYDFDNSGANIVDFDSSINGVVVCLDVTLDAIEFAHKNNANLILSHHPMVFHSYKNINDDIQSKRIKLSIKYGINAYSMHTNFDVNLSNGMGKIVVDKLFKKNEILKQDLLETNFVNKKTYGIGNIVELKKSIGFDKLVDKILLSLNIDKTKVSLYPVCGKKNISKIAILPGSGSGNVDDVIKNKVDCFVTSDLKHNQILDLIENGISYINATHYGLEKVFIEFMNDYIKKFEKNVFIFYDKNL